ncbi:MFS transporter [Paraburkholderia sp. 22098]|uniref:MFS transporter n=1 Tax=Paraburkholderia sp. 22098 TaxID=3453874 RepID=UPI003F859FEB
MQQPLKEGRGGGTRGLRTEACVAADAAPETVWYRSINRQQWSGLIASNLGWFFDGYETYALVLTVGGALGQLLAPSEHAQIPFYAGLVIALTLLGWGIGGLIGGILTDYIGRKRMMMFAILAYSLTTGLSALSWNWASFAALRFVVGLAMGSEWATGTAMTAEIWPDRHRGKGAGLMQCGLGTGFFVASLIWLFMSSAGEHAWRYMYLIGVLPGLATLWMRAGIPESEQWQHVNKQRKATLAQGGRGGARRAGTGACTLYPCRSAGRPETAPPHVDRRADVAQHDAWLVGHLHMGAALHRLRRGTCGTSRGLLGELRGHGL